MRAFSLYLQSQKSDARLKIAQGVRFNSGWCSMCFLHVVARPYSYDSLSQLQQTHPGLSLEWQDS